MKHILKIKQDFSGTFVLIYNDSTNELSQKKVKIKGIINKVVVS